MVKRSARIATVFFLVLPTMCAAGWGQDDSRRMGNAAPWQTAAVQHVVLKSGRVFSGNVEMAGGQFIVRAENGSTVRFERSEIDFVARSTYEAFNELRFRLRATDVDGHLRLANWCLRYRDLPAAREQIDYVSSISNRPRTMEMLERQLAKLKEQSAKTVQPDNSAASANKISNDAAANQREQLDELLNSLSIESLKMFASHVQPRLVNGCAISGCHSNHATPMRLWPQGVHGGVSTTAGKRNLQSTMKFIDRTNTLDSPLLKFAATPHGGLDQAVYDAGSPHLQAIKDWLVTTAVYSERPAASLRPDSMIRRTAFEQPDGTRSADENQPAAAARTPPLPGNLNLHVDSFVPRDEFDPEIFHRRHSVPAGRRAKGPVKPPASVPNRVRNLPPTEPSKGSTHRLPPSNDG